MLLRPLLVLLLLAPPSSSEDSGALANALVFSCPHWNDCRFVRFEHGAAARAPRPRRERLSRTRATTHTKTSGHGKCLPKDGGSKCTCDEGWGAASDNTLIKTPDCSQRVCPTGPAWGAVPVGLTKTEQREHTNDMRVEAHTTAVECSNAGLCNRGSGACECFEGFAGASCERTRCPGEADGMPCSGRGSCLNLGQMARLPRALPLVNGAEASRYSRWDHYRIYACLCESGWPVGLGDGETQAPEYFGADCSLRRCPSGDDPHSTADETNCEGVLASGGHGAGLAGNKW